MEESLREKEFSRLGATVYVDFAGAGLHCNSQAVAISSMLNQELMLNPHSSPKSAFLVDQVRQDVLDLFGAGPEYAVIWTAGATAALKLIGENADWSHPNSFFAYHSNCHNSVLGIRQYAAKNGARVVCVQHSSSYEQMIEQIPREARGIFAVPSQCNFSGRTIRISQLVQMLRRERPSLYILVDIAASASHSPAKIAEMDADFFCVSFYKMFGLPSGLGAAIVRKRSAETFLTEKTYFGGGTVEASSARETTFVKFRKGLSERFEDGSVAFLSIASLRCSIQCWQNIAGSMVMSEERTFLLAKSLAVRMLDQKHWNGSRVFVVYGDWNVTVSSSSSSQGPIVTFNVLRSDGSYVGYREVERLAQANSIVLRTGCFCNPGACEEFLNLSFENVQENLAEGHVCWDDKDVIHGKPTGAVRVSFGWPSTVSDVEAVWKFLHTYFVEEKESEKKTKNDDEQVEVYSSGELLRIMLYPVKSCSGMSVSKWPIGEKGLLYDREWVVIDLATGQHLSQKKTPQLALIRATVSLDGSLTLSASGKEPLHIASNAPTASNDGVSVCDDVCQVVFYADIAISDWLFDVLSIRCRLARLQRDQFRGYQSAKIAFANEGQFLVISSESLERFNAECATRGEAPCDVSRFRCNLFVSGGPGAHFEDRTTSFRVCGQQFLHLSKCARCEMVCVDQTTGQSNAATLKTLSTYRRERGNIFFGALFNYDPSSSVEPREIQVGEKISFTVASE